MVQYGYQYDAMGNPTQRTEDDGVSAYTYNNLNQLVTGDWSGTFSVFGWTATDALDHVQVETGTQSKTADVFQQGEWTAKQFDVPAGDNVFTVTRVATDQTTTRQQTTVTRPADQTQYQHDANGNLLGDGQWTYTWNNENRLTAAVIPQQKRLEFVYDFQGRRRIKKVYTWNAQTQQWTLERETDFIWLDWLLLETRDVTDNRRTDYILGTDLSGSFSGAGGIGGILCSVTTDSEGDIAHQCFLYDFNGDVVNLADPVTGDCTATYEYSPFGKLLISHGPSSDSNPIRFSTKWQDETGFYYYGMRYYSPELGRWVNRDPANAPSIRLRQRKWKRNPGTYPYDYGFVTNSPIIEIDYLGLFSLSPVGCCDGKRYFKLTHCCCKKKIVARLPKPTGVYSCKEPGVGGHRWLQIGSWAVGLYPSGSIWGSRGAVEIPDHHAVGDPASSPKCKPVKRNPCHTDFALFKLKLRMQALSDSIDCPYPSSSPACGLVYMFPVSTCENYAIGLAQDATVDSSGGGKCTVLP